MRDTVLRTTAVALVAFATAAGTAAASTTRTVCDTGCDHGTIQGAVDASAAGDTVDVAAGTYHEQVTVPQGKDGLTIRGPLHGVPGSLHAVDGRAEATVSASTGFLVRASGVALDGLQLRDATVGVQIESGTSGVAVRNTLFTDFGAGVVVLSSTTDPTVVDDNLFARSDKAVPWGPGAAISTGLAGGLRIRRNRAHTVPAFVTTTGTGQGDIEITGNRTGEAVGWLAQLHGVRGVLVQDNVMEERGDGGVELLETRDVVVARNRLRGAAGVRLAAYQSSNPGPADTQVLENDLDADTAIDAPRSNAFEGYLRVHRNRLGGDAGIVNATGRTVDARDNFWGCNGGPNAAGCATASGAVSATRWLTLTLVADAPSIPADGVAETGLLASLATTNTGETLTAPLVSGLLVAFDATGGGLHAGAAVLVDGAAPTRLTSDDGDGADVIARLDHATATAHVTFVHPSAMPEPRPERPRPAGPAAAGPSGTQGAATTPAPAPVGPAGGTGPAPQPATATAPRAACRISGRVLRCTLTGRRPATGARLTLTAGRTVIGGRVTAVRGGRIVARLTRAARPGRYVLRVAGRRRTVTVAAAR